MSEKIKTEPQLTQTEKEVLVHMAKGNKTIFIKKDGQENITVTLDDGTPLDLVTVMAMCRKGWLCRRHKPDRYRLTSKGERVIAIRL